MGTPAPNRLARANLVADAEWVSLAGARPLDDVPLHELKQAGAAVIRADGAWDRIRAWRSVGIAIGVVVVGEDAPEDRPRLEPVALLRRVDADGLAEALERLEVGEQRARVPLATGTADVHRGRFERPGAPPIKLTGLEARLLAYLASRSFRVVGRQELQEQVWGYRAALETKTVEMNVARLRKKIGAESVLTVRGEGYRAVRVEEAPQERVLEAFRRGATLMLQHGLLEQASEMLDHHVRTRRTGDRREEAEERVLRARLRWAAGDLAGAEDAARRALELAQDDPWLRASASCALAPVLRVTGRRSEGLGAVESALATFDALDDDGGRARALALRADFEAGPEAHALAARALACWERGRAAIDDGWAAQPLHAALLMRVGNGCWLAGELDAAEARYRRAAELYELLGNHEQRAQALLGAASIAFDRGEDAECRRRLDEALRVLPARATRVRARAKAFAAVVELVTGEPERALVWAGEAAAGIGVGPGVEASAYTDVVWAAARLATGDRAGAAALLAAARVPDSGWPALPVAAAWLRRAVDPSAPAPADAGTVGRRFVEHARGLAGGDLG